MIRDATALYHSWILSSSKAQRLPSLCYVSQVGGPSITQISNIPGATAGTRRLRQLLARQLAGQLASVVALIHSLGIVHGGRNVFRPNLKWS